MARRHHAVIRTPWGDEFEIARNKTKEVNGPFGDTLMIAMDAMRLWHELHALPKSWPLLVFGRPILSIRGQEMVFHKSAIDILLAGHKFEILVHATSLLCQEMATLSRLR